jgi:hypothetical protein
MGKILVIDSVSADASVATGTPGGAEVTIQAASTCGLPNTSPAQTLFLPLSKGATFNGQDFYDAALPITIYVRNTERPLICVASQTSDTSEIGGVEVFFSGHLVTP